MERLQNKHAFGFMAVSLAYFDTLMSLSAASTSSEMSSEDLATSHITTGYVRMSIGITGEPASARVGGGSSCRSRARCSASPSVPAAPAAIAGTLEQRWAQLEEAYTFITVKGGANAPFRAIKASATHAHTTRRT